MSSNNMSAKVAWVDGMTFVATSGSGHQVVMDGDNPGNAPSPMEMVLMSAGSCASVDVVSILKKAKQNLQRCYCELSGTRAESVPKVFTDIHLEFVVVGNDINEKHVERAVKLSADKYCSVAKMLEAAVKMTHSYRIESPQQDD